MIRQITRRTSTIASGAPVEVSLCSDAPPETGT